MEHLLPDEAMERRFNPELDQEPMLRLLGSLGIVDALSTDTRGELEHPEDNRWILS